jgi:hypothetical protein
LAVPCAHHHPRQQQVGEVELRFAEKHGYIQEMK